MRKAVSVLMMGAVLSLTALSAALAETHVAVIKGRSLKPYDEAAAGIAESLRRADPEIQVEQHDLEGDLENAAGIAELVRKREVRLVFVIGTEAFQAMKDKFNAVPIVMAMVYDPLAEGLVRENEASNLYGVYLRVPFSRKFEVIRKMLPKYKTLAVLYRAGTHADRIEEAKRAAALHGIHLTALGLETMDRFSSVLEEADSKSEALMMVLDQELYNSSTLKELFLFSARNKYPVIAISPNYVQGGALMSVSSDFGANGESAGRLGLRLLKGEEARPRFIPTEKAKVSWNTHVAQSLGVDEPKEGIDERL